MRNSGEVPDQEELSEVSATDPWIEGQEIEPGMLPKPPKPPTKLTDDLVTDQELIDMDLPPVKWLYPHLIPNPGLVAFVGRPGSYKTFFAQWLARRLSAGLNLFDKDESTDLFLNSAPPTKSIPVLFIEEEMSLRQMRDRTVTLKPAPDASKFFHLVSSGFNLKDPDQVEQLKSIVREHKIQVLILDPFTSVTRMRDENSNSEAAEVMDIIRHEFVQNPEFELTVIFIHHPAKNAKGKDVNIRGAGDILGKCDMAFSFQAHEGSSQVTIRYRKSRDLSYEDMRPFSMELRKVEGDEQYLEWVLIAQPDSVGDEPDKKDALKDEILEILEGELSGLTRKELSDIIGMGTNNNTFQRAWNELKEEGRIVYKDKAFHYNMIV